MSDDTITVCKWTERPFTGHRKRHIDVHHRVRIHTYSGAGMDVVHEIRSEYGPKEGWTVTDAWEYRSGRMNHVQDVSEPWAGRVGK